MTIGARFEPRGNALNALRLTLAVMVIVSHSRPIGGFGPDPRFGDVNLGALAVGGFFTISGFLITASRLNSSFLGYGWRRARRIMPGFWVCLLVTAFVLAPVTAAVRGGWTLAASTEYVVRQSLLYRAGSFTIGDTLAGVPYPTWNASLWTLFYEASCYVVVGVLVFSALFRRRAWPTLAAFALSTVVAWISYAYGTPGTAGLLAVFLPWFLAGATLLRFADRIPLTWWGATVMAVVLAVMAWGGVVRLVAALPVAYLCLWLGVALPVRTHRICVRNDISYGMYLYAFPVQQLLLVLGAQRVGALAFTAASVGMTVPAAWGSWLLVERPALRWKLHRLRAAMSARRSTGTVADAPGMP